MPTAARLVRVGLPLLLVLAGCGSAVPDTATGIIDLLEDAGVASCESRREPVPDIVTCEDPDGGDLTVGLVDDPVTSVARTADGVDGPWVVGEDFVVITYDDDVDRARAIVDALDSGRLYDVDAEGTPQPLDPG